VWKLPSSTPVLGDSAQPVLGGAAGVVGGGQPVVELIEVAHQREREKLLLAGEMPVDDGPVDPDRARDVLDLRVANSAGVEESAGGVEDLLLAQTAA